ncbi:MAG TPA: MarR family transcriptional regulator [Ignisphaera aggregans]|uniref:MarR family transcriptional regulator n=1 Tax=Ignisphaera aggregans TaxID=334771 RepID=A0A832Z4H6_9CREN|nr:MarR family transcriptional regulator [Ignisphaera aggregans]
MVSEDLKLRILRILKESRNGVTQSVLARALGVSKSYLSTVIRELEKQGIVYRVRLGNSYIVKLSQQPLPREERPRRLSLGIVWSSEYLFLASFAKMLRDRMGIELQVRVYPSALQATLALVEGEVDAVLSPFVSQVYAYLLTRRLTIVGGGARGGAAIYAIPNAKSVVITSSELSTMDLCRALAIRKGVVDAETTRYFHHPEEAVAMAKMRKVGYLVVWHPLMEDMERMGMKRVAMCDEFSEIEYCCTLALSRSLDSDIMERIARVFSESIELFKRKAHLYLDWYSAITGIDISILKRALNVYSYEPYIDLKKVMTMVKAMSVEVPDVRQLIPDAILKTM